MTAARRGFVLGKFLPPHAGHVFLCDSAAAMVDEMSVLLCSTDAEPIDGGLRRRWLTELLPQCRILHMHRDIPQTPEDHEDFWAIWRAAIAEFHPEPIARVFGAETYVFRLAQELNATPVLIDPARSIFPVSSSSVRADPAGNWRFVPGPVRPHFQTRICLLGPESSGKSTLAGLLADRFGATAMPEYGRDYDACYRQGTGWSGEDFIALAETHRATLTTILVNFLPARRRGSLPRSPSPPADPPLVLGPFGPAGEDRSSGTGGAHDDDPT